MPDTRAESQIIEMLLVRLERISADSSWAHRASGIRGSLPNILNELQSGSQLDPNNFTDVITNAFRILTQAAKRS